jgi:hypothetical protein
MFSFSAKQFENSCSFRFLQKFLALLVKSYNCQMITKNCKAIFMGKSEKNFRDSPCRHCTDKKENKIFLIYKEIQKGAVAQSYMTNGLLIYMTKFLRISSYIIRKPILIDDFATAPIWLFLYMRKILFYFL